MRSRTRTRRGRLAQAGVTLLELMIVVAIIGVLVGIAVYLYTRTTKQAKAKSEVYAMIAEFKSRQRDFHAENGVYLTMGTDDTDQGIYHPAPSNIKTATVIAPLPAEWRQLKLRPDRTALYCAYTTIGGNGGDGTNIGTRANLFGMTTAPATNWFYVIAECDLDGDPAVNTLFFARADADAVAVQNEGK